MREPNDESGGEQSHRPNHSESSPATDPGDLDQVHELEHVIELDLREGGRMRVLVPGGLSEEDLKPHLAFFRETDRRLTEIKARLAKEEIGETAEHIRGVLSKDVIADGVARLATLPGRISTHHGISGRPDHYSAKSMLLTLPAVTVALSGLLVKRGDPDDECSPSLLQ